MSITLDPAIDLVNKNEHNYKPGNEDNSILIYGHDWMRDCHSDKMLKSRYVKIFAENIQGHSVLLCRFLGKVAPPPEVYKDGNNN